MTDPPKTWFAAIPGSLCSAGSSRSGHLILWGITSRDGFEALERVDISGCCIADEDSTHECTSCGDRFDQPRRAAHRSDDRRGTP